LEALQVKRRERKRQWIREAHLAKQAKLAHVQPKGPEETG
jgi:hypothetical protein